LFEKVESFEETRGKRNREQGGMEKVRIASEIILRIISSVLRLE